MGILNVTPDSFSDGGRFTAPSRAVRCALRLQSEGADLIDIGGESTRPGAKGVLAQAEIKRVLPVIERLEGRLSIPISIDTSKAAVAQAACAAGASMVNDVTALGDPRMAEVVAAAGVPVVLMHMRGTPRTMQKNIRYRRLIPEIQQSLRASIRRARACGITAGQILVDPGIGFGKSIEQNLQLIQKLATFKAMGFPVVVGPSRKSFIGHLLGLPVEERLLGTAAAVALSVARGADIVRVHDVKAMRQVADVAHALAKGKVK